MLTDIPGLMDDIRARFEQVDTCPLQGRRIFFENAGGALTLKSVVERSAEYAGLPDNQGRDNVASVHSMGLIDQSRQDMRTVFNAAKGQVFIGESGTELLFRLIRTACLGVAKGGRVLGSTLEHPASSSAAVRWAEITGKTYFAVPHNSGTGTVTAQDYLPHIHADTRVATIVHASPVTGMAVDVAAIAAAIRSIAPDCITIVDGIQHAAHGALDIDSYGVDGYVISPYKMFSRHGYGIAWISDRLAAMPHDMILGAPDGPWELGTRDTGSYATFSDVVAYLDWLGGRVSNGVDPRTRIEAAGRAIATHEAGLTKLMLQGQGPTPGLVSVPGITIIGGADNPNRKGLVSFVVDGHDPAQIVQGLSDRGIRTHIRKADHYSGNVLKPLGLDSCVRVSLCHYNTETEVLQFLGAMAELFPDMVP